MLASLFWAMRVRADQVMRIMDEMAMLLFVSGEHNPRIMLSERLEKRDKRNYESQMLGGDNLL